MSLTPDALINKSTELVSPPNTYLQLMDLLNDPDSSIDDISAVINTDPALTTRLLKIVNSPFYGFPSQINTISRAITIVGTRELIQLVLATTVIERFNGIPDDLIDMTMFWKHSLASAVTAKLLAKQAGQRSTERFFIAGLLQNIGSLVLYQSMPEIAREAINSAEFGNELLHMAEQRLLGFDHTHIGQALVQKWRLPESLEKVVRFHHTPSEADKHELDVAIVHIADILVTAVPFGHSGDQHVPPLDTKAWDLINLNVDDIPDLLETASTQLDSLASVMLA
jgi:HD-like signal output (HDOD) protein